MGESDGLEDKDVYKAYAASRNRMLSHLVKCQEGVASLPSSPMQSEILKFLQEAVTADLHPLNQSALCLAANLMCAEDIASIEQELAGEDWRSQTVHAATVRLEKLKKDGAKYREAYNQYRKKVHDMRLEAEEKQAELCDKDAQIVALQARCSRMEEELSNAHHAVASNSVAAASQASAFHEYDSQGDVDGYRMDRKEQIISSLKQQLTDEQERAHQAVTAQAGAESDLAHEQELRQEMENELQELRIKSRHPGPSSSSNMASVQKLQSECSRLTNDLIVARRQVDANASKDDEILSLRDECQKLRIDLEESQQSTEPDTEYGLANDKFHQQQEHEIFSLRQRLDRANANVERLKAQANLPLETPANMQHDPLRRVSALLITSQETSDTIRHLSDHLLYGGKMVPGLRRNCLVFDKKAIRSAVSRMPLQTFLDILARGITLNPKDSDGRPVINKQRRRNFQTCIVILGALALGGGFYEFDGVPQLGQYRAREDIQETIAALLQALKGTIVDSVFDTLDDFRVYAEGKALFADKLVHSIEYLKRSSKNIWRESPKELSSKTRKECLHESQVNILVEMEFISTPKTPDEADGINSGSETDDGSVM